MDIIFQFLTVFFLVLLNGYFVASEFALVAVRRTRIDELVKKGNAGAKLVRDALQDLDSYISATQLGITIASLALGWIGEPAVARFLEPFFGFLPGKETYITSHSVAVFIAFALITFLHIVLGELAPKTIALQKSELTSLVVIAPLILFTKIFHPVILLLNEAGSLILRVFGFSILRGQQLVHSEEEIKMILAHSTQEGIIEKGEAEMVYNVFKLGDIPVKNVMVPRTDVVAFNKNALVKDIVKQVRSNQVYSRFPLYDRTIDTVIGFVHIKDVYKEVLKGHVDKKLIDTNIIREILSVPETKKVDEVLFDMKRERVHIAIIQDEYGGTSGLVTLEDILESVMGDIEDEFDKPINDIKRMSDGSFIVDAKTSIERVQKRFNLRIKGQGYLTIGGLVFGLIGREPSVGDTIQLADIVFEIEEMDRKRIKTLRLRKEKNRRLRQP